MTHIDAQQKSKRSYQQCARCVMDTSAADIVFDEQGVCNYCRDFLERSGHIINESPEQKKRRLDELVALVKKDGAGKPYDCVVGVSGGVDSSWALVQAVRLGLRPLAVHMDNGWNTKLAENNIANLVRGLGVDLYTYVIEWKEYQALLQAFLDADVIDVELLYDNAMLAVNYRQAAKYDLHYILAGYNQATEGLAIPKGWNWFKLDKRNIKYLGRKFGNIRLETFPAIGFMERMYLEYVKNIHMIAFLDYFPYNKFEALDMLEKEYHYTRYPYKHYESIFTRFYQGYLLPKKFGVDKRLVHLAALVASGQMSREEALAGLRGIPYPSEQDQENDIQQFLMKMDWSRDDLNRYLNRPEISHAAYPSEKGLQDLYLKYVRIIPREIKDIFKHKV